MIETFWLFNTIAIAILIYPKHESERRFYSIVIATIAINILSAYVIAYTQGSSSLTFSIYDIDIPLILILIAVPLFMFLKIESLTLFKPRLIILFIVCIVFTLFSQPSSIKSAITAPDVLTELIYTMLLVVGLCGGLLIALVVLYVPGKSLYEEYFKIGFSVFKQYPVQIIGGMAGLIVVYYLGFALLFEKMPSLVSGQNPISIVVEIFFVVLLSITVQHTIYLGLTKYMLNQFRPGDYGFSVEVVSCASIAGFVQFFSGYPMQALLLVFPTYLILGYLFAKTKSLSYGIIVYAIVRVLIVSQ